MTEAVVVGLEVIDIDDEDRATAAHRSREAHQTAPIGDAGKRVGMAFNLELPVGRFQFRAALLETFGQPPVFQRQMESVGKLVTETATDDDGKCAHQEKA